MFLQRLPVTIAPGYGQKKEAAIRGQLPVYWLVSIYILYLFKEFAHAVKKA